MMMWQSWQSALVWCLLCAWFAVSRFWWHFVQITKRPSESAVSQFPRSVVADQLTYPVAIIHGVDDPCGPRAAPVVVLVWQSVHVTLLDEVQPVLRNAESAGSGIA